MTLHAGTLYTDDDVSIAPPDPGAVRRAMPSSDVAPNIERWLTEAEARDDVCYFSVYRGAELVGQIMLHDIDEAAGESLVGYHLFEPRFRGRGIGAKALGLLQRFVVRETELRSLVAIAMRDNIASCSVARKSGFVESGAAREDPVNGVVFRWTVPGRA